MQMTIDFMEDSKFVAENTLLVCFIQSCSAILYPFILELYLFRGLLLQASQPSGFLEFHNGYTQQESVEKQENEVRVLISFALTCAITSAWLCSSKVNHCFFEGSLPLCIQQISSSDHHVIPHNFRPAIGKILAVTITGSLCHP